MERVLSQEDRIRRAEEIYYRRNSPYVRSTTVNVNSHKEYKMLKIILIQLLICVGIYCGIYWLQKSTDSFSTDSIGYIKNWLGYDEDIEGLINKVKNYIDNWRTKEEAQEENSEEISTSPEETIVESEEKEEQNVNEVLADEENNKSQMEKDADYIKANFSLIKPVIGTITSRFGPRNPTTPTVPKYHTGIDIAVNEGTVFVASMEGTVEQVSSQGDYR